MLFHSKAPSTINLPRKIASTYSVQECLRLDVFSTVLLLTHTKSGEKKILKKISSRFFSRKRSQVLSHLSDTYLLLPEKILHIGSCYYLFYPFLPTFSTFLRSHPMTLQQLLSLGIDLTHAAEELMCAGIYSADIHPQNIYFRKDHFCLGDLNYSDRCDAYSDSCHAPEKIPYAKRTAKQFDQLMQYTICQLLLQLLQQVPDMQNDTIRQTLSTGCRLHPEQRFSSLIKLRDSLLLLQGFTEVAQNPSTLRYEHIRSSLFQQKTHKQLSKNSIKPFLIVWSALICVGCIGLILFYRSLHTSNIPVADSAPQIQSTLCTTSPPPSELDVQKKGLHTLEDLFDQIEDPSTISVLYAGENAFTSAELLPSFIHIKELYMNKNQLSSLPDLSALSELEVLVLSSNQIKEASCLSSLSGLKYLDLSSNPAFDDIESLFSLSGLTTLNLTNTSVSQAQYQQLQKQLPDCMIFI